MSNHTAEAMCALTQKGLECPSTNAPSIPLSTAPLHTYEKTGFTLTHTPMICTFEPTPNPLILNLGMDLRRMTESAIPDWEYHLNGFRSDAWNVVLNEVSYDKISTFNSSKCDITISYLPSPTSSPNSEEPVGVTTYDFTNHKAHIIIYYLKMTWDLQTTETRDSNYIYYHYTPTFSYVTNQIATEDQIGVTIRHELGHAFGLGHYSISQQETDSLVNGNGGSIPSIMVPIVIPQSGNYYGITSYDTNELKSLYGQSGFNQPVTSTMPPVVSPTTSQPTTTPSPTLQSPEEHVENDPKYASLKNSILTDIKYGINTDANFESSVLLLAQDGLVNLNLSEKSNGSVIKPHSVDLVIKLWINNEISDREYSSCLQYFYDSKLLILK